MNFATSSIQYALHSAMDYTLNIVSKCRFSLHLNIRGLQTGPGKLFTASWEVLDFLSVKEWEPRCLTGNRCIDEYLLVSFHVALTLSSYWLRLAGI